MFLAFQLFKCEDLLLLFVIYDIKIKNFRFSILQKETKVPYWMEMDIFFYYFLEFCRPL